MDLKIEESAASIPTGGLDTGNVASNVVAHACKPLQGRSLSGLQVLLLHGYIGQVLWFVFGLPGLSGRAWQM